MEGVAINMSSSTTHLAVESHVEGVRSSKALYGREEVRRNESAA